MATDLTTAYLRWSLVRAALARGWWLTTALYLVVIADLSSAQLVLIGVFQGVTVVLAEVPAGVLADAHSRRQALVVAHVVTGAGMALTGFVTSYPLLVASQCLWGLGWAISSGTDVAWITDELDRSDVIDRVLVAQGRYGLLGTPVGIVALGALAWATTLAAAMVVAGLAMIGLGLIVVTHWPEARPPAGGAHQPQGSVAILRRGAALARADRTVLLVLGGTLLVNGGAEGFGRLFEQRMVTLGLPAATEPIVWFGVVALAAAVLGAVTVRCVETRVESAGVARRAYVVACGAGAAGLVVFALAPTTAPAVAGALLVSGVGLPTVRVAGTILVNRRATSDVRATVHSMLSQAENLGEIVFGLGLAVIAGRSSSSATLLVSGALVAGAGLVVGRVHDGGRLVPDAIFGEPRLAEVYDAVDGDRSDLDAYVAVVEELAARTLLDVGCGTGSLACRLAQQGKEVTGLDPAGASLAVARRKPGADRVRWIESDAGGAPTLGVDLVTMTGNVAQVFLTDADWHTALRAARAALRPGGHLVFEVRDPARRAWETWTRDVTHRVVLLEGTRAVETWIDVTDVALPLVSFRHTYVFDDGAVLTSDSTLRFRDHDEVVTSLERAGFVVRDVRDAPDRPGLEWVFLAQRPVGEPLSAIRR